MATHEMNAFKAEYQATGAARTRRPGPRRCKAAGLDVQGDPADGYTETHQVLIRVSQYGPAEQIARRLEENNLVCNYQALPDDESFLASSGLRTGVQEMTRFGMEPARLREARRALRRLRDPRPARWPTRRRRTGEKFLTMRYCLPAEEAIPLAARVLASVFPRADYAKALAENLVK